MSFNTYGQSSKNFNTRYQVWSEVKGVKHSGGTIEGFEDYPVGATIPAGTPVALNEAGGTLTPFFFYEVAQDVSDTDTEVVLYGSSPLASTGNLMVAPSEIGGEGTGVAYTGAQDEGNGKYSITITADAFGELKAGDALALADSAGEDAVIASEGLPSGLLWHDIVKEEGDTLATGAVVDKGRIFEDRIVAIPSAYKRHLEYVGISFEKGI